MRILLALTILNLSLWAADSAVGQTESKAVRGVKLGESQVERWRIGMIVSASGGPCSRMVGTTTVPMDWPEQRAKIVDQDLTPGVSVSYKTINGTVRQMIVKIPALADGAEARAIITFEIERNTLLPPDDTDVYVAADPKTLKGALKDYLGPSPTIESGHPRIKALAKEIGADQTKAWDRINAFYDWVRKKIQYEKDAPLTGVVEAIDKGTGDCNELTSTFIALCRASGIPARTVRLPKHCYPEFYLQDDKGEGHWFPCEASGSEAFGGILTRNPIMQKGDNFRLSVPDPGSKRTKVEAYRFLPESLTGVPRPNGGQPQMKLVCQPIRE